MVICGVEIQCGARKAIDPDCPVDRTVILVSRVIVRRTTSAFVEAPVADQPFVAGLRVSYGRRSDGKNGD